MDTLRMTQEIAQLSFWDAIGADDLVASEIMQSPLEGDESFPFDRIESDSSLDFLLWNKTFDQGLTYAVPFPVARAYFCSLMPEIREFAPGPSKVFAVWRTDDPGRVMSETFDSMSPTTKAILEGSTTFQEIFDEFFTTEVTAKALALWDSPVQYRHDEILRILMDGESVALAEGAL
jgi:hypothetical protein